ncbi:MAG TPA: DUF6428 family protein [Saprospiraceae bacterium]|nr:DUF6428 family protein [Saprospiraceae bacterium]
MLLSELKSSLESLSELVFILPDGKQVPKHFHITEIGLVSKKFIDCGGVIRDEKIISMQLWESIDVWHRLQPSKLLSIVNLSVDKLELPDLTIEVEYQRETIGKYQLQFNDGKFYLTSMNTACLAQDQCGIPIEKVKRNLNELILKTETCCSPNSSCCS